MKRILSVFLLFVIITGQITVCAAEFSINDTAAYLKKTINNPSVSSIGGEWTVIGLARSGKNGYNTYFDTYYKNAEKYIKEKKGVLSDRKYTEYSRVVTALCAIGKNPENVGGYDLVKPLTDFDKTTVQGINGAAFALIALDCGDFGGADIRNKYVDYILGLEKKNGGWSLSKSGTEAEVDVTAMVLTALSGYTYRDDVKWAVKRAVAFLSEKQNSKGGYSLSGENNSESTAQVLLALSALGISYTDKRFVKNGKTVADALLSYKNSDGSFKHTTESNLMSTEQCFYALVAAERMLNGKTRLFDMSDIRRKVGLSGKNANVSSVSVIYPGKTFGDISESKYKSQIESLSSRGIINGFNDNTFSQDKTITRAEFAAIVVRALGLPLENINTFTDVKSSDWYYSYVGAAYKYGIINGVSQTEFDPQGTITNEQACLMAERAAKLCGIANTLGNSDAKTILSKYGDGKNVSEWAYKGVAFCCDNKFYDTDSGRINPKVYIRRGEAAYLLYNILKGARLI